MVANRCSGAIADQSYPKRTKFWSGLKVGWVQDIAGKNSYTETSFGFGFSVSFLSVISIGHELTKTQF
jgi:hypothetical protein